MYWKFYVNLCCVAICSLPEPLQASKGISCVIEAQINSINVLISGRGVSAKMTKNKHNCGFCGKKLKFGEKINSVFSHLDLPKKVSAYEKESPLKEGGVYAFKGICTDGLTSVGCNGGCSKWTPYFRKRAKKYRIPKSP